MNTYRIGKKIKDLRHDKKKLTRRAFLAKFNQGRGDKLHEMTLYKYERGLLRIPKDLIPAFAKALDVKEADLTGTDDEMRRLRIGVQRYPDSDFLAFVAREFKQYDPTQPPLDAETIPWKEDADSSSAAVLDALAHEEGKDPIDVALFNESEFNRLREKYAAKIIDFPGVVRFSGYSLLFAPPRARLVSFREHYNGIPNLAGRQARLSQALWRTLSQLVSGDAKGAKLLYSAESDRASLLRCLIDLVRREVRSEAEHDTFRALEAAFSSGGGAEGEVFRTFHEATQKTGAAGALVFVGNLAQRLAAEENGASILVSQEDLTALAAWQSKEIQRVLQPMNCLLVNRKVFNERYDQILTLNHRWNEAAHVVKNKSSDPTLHAFLNKSVLAALERMEGSEATAQTMSIAGIARELVQRIYSEQMIEFLPWDRPREHDPENDDD